MPSSSRKGSTSSRGSVPSLRSMSSVSSMSTSPSSSPKSSPKFAAASRIPTVTPVRSAEGEEVAVGGRGQRRSRSLEDEDDVVVRPAVAMDIGDGLERQRGPIRPEDGRLVFQFTPFGLVRQSSPPPATRDSPVPSPATLRQSIFRRRTSDEAQLSSVAAKAASAALTASFELERDDISRTTLWPLRRCSDGPRLVTLITGRGANKRPRIDGLPPRSSFGRNIQELPIPTTPHTMPLLEEDALLQSPPLSVAQRACRSSSCTSIPWYAQSLESPQTPSNSQAGVTGHCHPDLPTPPPPPLPPASSSDGPNDESTTAQRVFDLFQECKPRPSPKPSRGEDSHVAPVSPAPTTMHPVETPTRLTAASVGIDLGRSLLAGGGDRDTCSLLLSTGDLCMTHTNIPQVSPLGSLAALAVAKASSSCAGDDHNNSNVSSSRDSLSETTHDEPFDEGQFGLQHPPDCTPRRGVLRSTSLPTLPQRDDLPRRLQSRPAVDSTKALSPGSGAEQPAVPMDWKSNGDDEQVENGDGSSTTREVVRAATA